MSQNYSVNHGNQEILITKAFGRKASNPKTVEFKILATLHKTFPEYSIGTRTIQVNRKKKLHDNLNYANMEEFIKHVEGEGSPLHKEFKTQRILARRESAQYVFIKKWFLSQFPDYDITEEWIRIVGTQSNQDALV